MAVTRRDLNRHRWTNAIVMPATLPRFYRMQQGANMIAGVLFLIAISMLLTFTWTIGKTRLDDLRYGMPRTYHMTANVGHGSSGQPSHLIALNLDRQIVVIDVPGGDASQTRTLMGPYLFGAEEHLTPVLLDLNDYNQDNLPDLVVKVKNEKLIYINQDGNFRPTTPEEHAQIVAAATTN